MKGIVFTELFDMVETHFGLEMVQNIIDDAQLPNHGAYTKVGTYDHKEIYRLVGALSQRTDTDANALIKAFGKHLLQTFVASYPALFENSSDSFSFLSGVHDYIHVEVRKIYPDADLPHFATIDHPDGSMDMVYTSSKKMYALAEGLIEATMEHYNEAFRLDKEFIEEDGSKVRFTISKK
ncbi:MAG: heme NO-binding domain-containing protein [Saprospiraceae bacterium]|nr:heme NO-binding domain-containing protein [Saprospiraceae bacterium]